MTNPASDITVAATIDTITDFVVGVDIIDTSSYTVNGAASFVDQVDAQGAVDQLGPFPGPLAAANAVLNLNSMNGNARSKITAFVLDGTDTFVVATNTGRGNLAADDLMIKLSGQHFLTIADFNP